MQEKLSAVWKCRHFWLSLVRMDLRTRYRGSVLGIGWSLLHPIAMTIVVCVVFHKLLKQEIRTFGPFLLAGISFWSYVTNVTLRGCQCLYQGEPYIRQFPAPMAIYPLRAVLGAGFHGLVGLGVVLGATWILHGFENITALIALVPIIFLTLVAGWSLAVLLGFASVHFPDLQHLTEVGLQILFYATPIMYPPSLLEENGLGWLNQINPLSAFVQVIREPILNGQFPSADPFAIVCLTTLAMFGAAVATLAKLERQLIFHL